MSDTNMLELIKEELADVAPHRTADFQTITLENTIESLELDSITTMEMVGFIEERLDITLEDEDLAEVKTLNQLASLVTNAP